MSTTRAVYAPAATALTRASRFQAEPTAPLPNKATSAYGHTHQQGRPPSRAIMLPPHGPQLACAFICSVT